MPIYPTRVLLRLHLDVRGSNTAGRSTPDRQLITRRRELTRTIREDSLDRLTQATGGKLGGVDAHLVDEYEEIGREIDRRVTARALLHRTEPPTDLLGQIGARSEAADPLA